MEIFSTQLEKVSLKLGRDGNKYLGMEMVVAEVIEEDNMHLQRMKKVRGLNLGKCQFLLSG